jgi:RimJ/RimL family protein N-acetyltransferase
VFHRSQRLFLRPAFPEDCGAIFAGIGEESIVRNLARAPWPYSLEDAQNFAAMPQDMRLPHFLVTLPGVGVIGSAGLGEHEGEAEIGYWIARNHWGRGYATEAAGAVLKIARTLGHRRVLAGHFADNPASGKVLRKLGFVPTGRPGQRFSAARGERIESVEYALDLEADMDPAPFARAA